MNNRSWTSAHWNAGGGVRLGITDFMDLALTMTYNYTYDDNYDGLPFSLSKVRLNAMHDAFLYHSAGLVFHFGENDGAYQFRHEDSRSRTLKWIRQALAVTRHACTSGH